MKIGQQLQNEYGKREDEEIKTQLEETFSLLAYSDPFSSPFAGLLHVQARELVANSLNSAILGVFLFFFFSFYFLPFSKYNCNYY